MKLFAWVFRATKTQSSFNLLDLLVDVLNRIMVEYYGGITCRGAADMLVKLQTGLKVQRSSIDLFYSFTGVRQPLAGR